MNAYDLPENFRNFCFMPKWDADIKNLAENIIEYEDWSNKNNTASSSYPVLENYIKYTYRRIAEEKKVSVTKDEKCACWNTGLITSNQEPVFILFNENQLPEKTEYWHFWKFARRGQHELTRFDKLPEMCHYFDDTSHLVYDTRKELRVNIEHIIEDNRERFPAQLQTLGTFGLQNVVNGAIESARERVKRNYKTAVPQYFQGSIQLLLPLCLTDPSKADLALVIERFSDFYRASTCLTLDMAYNNARQLARPDREWLQP